MTRSAIDVKMPSWGAPVFKWLAFLVMSVVAERVIAGEKAARPAVQKAGKTTRATPEAKPVESGRDLPTDPALLLIKGKEAFEKGDYREAEKIYELLLAKDPKSAPALTAYGVVLFRSQKFKGAEEAFKKALALDPKDLEAQRTLEIVHYSEQRYDEAVKELMRTIGLKPDDAVAHNYLGITASQKGWQETARKEVERAITIDPNYADAYFNLAVVFATQQPPDKENARQNYKRAVELGAEPDPALEQMLK